MSRNIWCETVMNVNRCSNGTLLIIWCLDDISEGPINLFLVETKGRALRIHIRAAANLLFCRSSHCFCKIYLIDFPKCVPVTNITTGPFGLVCRCLHLFVIPLIGQDLPIGVCISSSLHNLHYLMPNSRAAHGCLWKLSLFQTPCLFLTTSAITLCLHKGDI